MQRVQSSTGQSTECTVTVYDAIVPEIHEENTFTRSEHEALRRLLKEAVGKIDEEADYATDALNLIKAHLQGSEQACARQVHWSTKILRHAPSDIDTRTRLQARKTHLWMAELEPTLVKLREMSGSYAIARAGEISDDQVGILLRDEGIIQ